MLDIHVITTFLGWCSLINSGLFVFSSAVLIAGGDYVKGLHSKFFALNPDDLNKAYFRFLGNYKLAIIIFNITPYCALKLMF